MSLPEKTGLSLALKLKNGYPSMGGGEESRFYTIFDPGYVDLVTPWVASGSWAISGELSYTPISGPKTLVSGSENSEDAIIVDFNGTVLRAFAYVGTALQFVLQIGASEVALPFTSYSLTYDDTTGGVTLSANDGEVTKSNTWALDGNQDIRYLSIRAGAVNLFDGVQYNVSLDNGTDIRYYPLDTDSLTTARETLQGLNGQYINVQAEDKVQELP